MLLIKYIIKNALFSPDIWSCLDLIVISYDRDLVNKIISYVNASIQALLEFSLSCL